MMFDQLTFDSLFEPLPQKPVQSPCIRPGQGYTVQPVTDLALPSPKCFRGAWDCVWQSSYSVRRPHQPDTEHPGYMDGQGHYWCATCLKFAAVMLNGERLGWIELYYYDNHHGLLIEEGIKAWIEQVRTAHPENGIHNMLWRTQVLLQRAGQPFATCDPNGTMIQRDYAPPVALPPVQQHTRPSRTPRRMCRICRLANWIWSEDRRAFHCVHCGHEIDE